MEYKELKRGSPELGAWKTRLHEGVTILEASWLLWDLAPQRYDSEDLLSRNPYELPPHVYETRKRLGEWYVRRYLSKTRDVIVPMEDGEWQGSTSPADWLDKFGLRLYEKGLIEFVFNDSEEYPASIIKSSSAQVSRQKLLAIIYGLVTAMYGYQPGERRQKKGVIEQILSDLALSG